MDYRRNTQQFLAPPATTILLYAADGLAVWKEQWTPSGRPRTPALSVWVPIFHELAGSADGMCILQSLAEAGMRAWDLAPDCLNCLQAAFEDITFRSGVLAALEEYGHLTPRSYAPQRRDVKRGQPGLNVFRPS